jgi:hypothetical protein
MEIRSSRREISQDWPFDSRDICALSCQQSFPRVGCLEGLPRVRALRTHQLEHWQRRHAQLLYSGDDVGVGLVRKRVANTNVRWQGKRMVPDIECVVASGAGATDLLSASN